MRRVQRSEQQARSRRAVAGQRISTAVERPRGGGRRVDAGPTLADALGELVDRAGRPEQEALRLVGAECDERVGLDAVLDALGDHPQTERVRQVDDRFDDRFVGLRAAEAGDEAAVDLHRGDGQATQVGQRRVAGAEVVESDLHAESAQRRQAVDRAVEVLEHGGLGDLEADLARVEHALVDRRLDAADHLVGAGHLVGAEVDPHPRRRLDADRAELAERVEHAVEHPLADIGHQPGGLGDREELVGQQQRTVVARPAHECLEADDAPVAQVDDGLEVRPQVALGDRRVQLRLHPQGTARLAAELLDVLGRCAPLLLLGGPVGGLRLVEQLQADLAGSPVGVAGAHVQADLDRAEADRLAHGDHQPLGHLARLARRGPDEHGRERRAGIGEERVGRSGLDGAADHQCQRVVADPRAPAIVDVAEADDVQVDDAGGASRLGQPPPERGTRHQCRRASLGQRFGSGG